MHEDHFPFNAHLPLDSGPFHTRYDLRGNLTKKYREDASSTIYTEYHWDSRNKMTKVYDKSSDKTVEYMYDFAGRRVAKKVDSGQWWWYFYDGLNVVAEGVASGNKAYYTNASGGPGGIICRDANGTKLWYHFDSLGNVMAVTDSSGNAYAVYTMDAFGNVLEKGTSSGYASEHATDPQPYHITTKEWDEDIGLYFFNARWYDSTTGRFISREPTGLDGPSLYEFNFNNPINRYDPDGSRSKKPDESPQSTCRIGFSISINFNFSGPIWGPLGFGYGRGWEWVWIPGSGWRGYKFPMFGPVFWPGVDLHIGLAIVLFLDDHEDYLGKYVNLSYMSNPTPYGSFGAGVSWWPGSPLAIHFINWGFATRGICLFYQRYKFQKSRRRSKPRSPAEEKALQETIDFLMQQGAFFGGC